MWQWVNRYPGKKNDDFGFFLFRLDRVVLHDCTSTRGRAATLCFRSAISAYSKNKYLKRKTNECYYFIRQFLDIGLATPFHNYNRSGVFNESVFKNFFNLRQEK